MQCLKPQRIEDEALLEEIRNQPCCICGHASDPAHIKTKGSFGDDVPLNLMAICRDHHTEQHKIGIKTFFKKYPQVEAWETYKDKIHDRWG